MQTLDLDGIPVLLNVDGPSRQARLTVEPDGSLRLQAASDIPFSELETFLKSKRNWIYRRLADKQALGGCDVSKELVDGESFSYLGRRYRLKLVDDERVFLEGGRLRLPKGSSARGEAELVHWYSTRGMDWLRPRVEPWADRLQVRPSSISAAVLERKWGSASRAGAIKIHWATFQLAPRLIDYVVVHELVHLRVPNHGADFWTTLGRVMPDHGERKAELARAGARLWMGEVRPAA